MCLEICEQPRCWLIVDLCTSTRERINLLHISQALVVAGGGARGPLTFKPLMYAFPLWPSSVQNFTPSSSKSRWFLSASLTIFHGLELRISYDGFTSRSKEEPKSAGSCCTNMRRSLGECASMTPINFMGGAHGIFDPAAVRGVISFTSMRSLAVSYMHSKSGSFAEVLISLACFVSKKKQFFFSGDKFLLWLYIVTPRQFAARVKGRSLRGGIGTS